MSQSGGCGPQKLSEEAKDESERESDGGGVREGGKPGAGSNNMRKGGIQ